MCIKVMKKYRREMLKEKASKIFASKVGSFLYIKIKPKKKYILTSHKWIIT